MSDGRWIFVEPEYGPVPQIATAYAAAAGQRVQTVYVCSKHPHGCLCPTRTGYVPTEATLILPPEEQV